MALRQKVMEGCEQLIWDFFNSGGQCVIYDANNGRREHRQRVAAKFSKEGIHVVILGSASLLCLAPLPSFSPLILVSPCRIDL
jgi:6-phosphofructo-2-kinase/fructose-2,6-biphosphatase 4